MKKLIGAINPAVPTLAKKGETPSLIKKLRMLVPKNKKRKKKVR